MDKQEITVTYTEVTDYEGAYKADYQCPPHIWYYANLIMHWKCKFCPALRHNKPRNAYIDGENVIVKYNYVNNYVNL